MRNTSLKKKCVRIQGCQTNLLFIPSCSFWCLREYWWSLRRIKTAEMKLQLPELTFFSCTGSIASLISLTQKSRSFFTGYHSPHPWASLEPHLLSILEYLSVARSQNVTGLKSWLLYWELSINESDDSTAYLLEKSLQGKMVKKKKAESNTAWVALHMLQAENLFPLHFRVSFQGSV